MQFVAVILYAISLYANSCDVSTTFILMNFIHALLFFGLFLNFFVQNYIRRSNQRKAAPTTLVSNEKAQLCSKNHKSNLPKEENDDSGMEDVCNYRTQFHRCSKQEDCNLNCRAPVVRNGSLGKTEGVLNGGCGDEKLKFQ